MLKEESNGGTNNWARICDTCHSAPSSVYCRADSAFLCRTCDARIHAANRVASRHERVWVCESCERAPAAFLCKADAASLCTTCDSDIHSANPLARRHHRVPILPIPGTGTDIDTDDDLLTAGGGGGGGGEEADETDEDEAASWLLINPDRNSNQHNPFDEYLDLDEFNSDQQNPFNDQFNNNNNHHHHHQQQQQYSVPDQKSHGNDSGEAKKELHHQQQQHYQNFQLGMDYENSNTEYGYPASFSHTVSISSVLDVGIVPESTMSDDVSISHPHSHPRPPKGTIDLFSSPPIPPIPSQLNPTDREARVMRYREKKKARKFEKTIRYASRKAYAETRPRIKGRFAKRTTDQIMDVEVDQIFSTTSMPENGYGIVPSF